MQMLKAYAQTGNGLAFVKHPFHCVPANKHTMDFFFFKPPNAFTTLLISANSSFLSFHTIPQFYCSCLFTTN